MGCDRTRTADASTRPVEDLVTAESLCRDLVRSPSPPLVANGAPLLVDGVRRWVTWQELHVVDEDFPSVAAAFAADSGPTQRGVVGRAAACLLPQRPLVDYAADWFSRHRG